MEKVIPRDTVIFQKNVLYLSIVRLGLMLIQIRVLKVTALKYFYGFYYKYCIRWIKTGDITYEHI